MGQGGGWRRFGARLLASLLCCLVSMCVLRVAAHGAEAKRRRCRPRSSRPFAHCRSGRQPLLQRPDFADQQDSVRRLYEAANFGPLWLRSDRPTSQVAAILRTLSEADRRGLSPEDYDAARLREAAGALRFRLAAGGRRHRRVRLRTTVSVLRYP